jgi:hypothetical protein
MTNCKLQAKEKRGKPRIYGDGDEPFLPKLWAARALRGGPQLECLAVPR